MHCLSLHRLSNPIPDFYAHGVLDLVDKTLSTLYTKIARGDCDGAYSILEGLAVFNEIGGEWTGQSRSFLFRGSYP